MSTTDRPEGISPTAVESAPGLWRIDLQRHDLSIPGREVIQARVEFTPDSPPFRHFHPGEERIRVLQGTLEIPAGGAAARGVRSRRRAHGSHTVCTTRRAMSARVSPSNWPRTSSRGGTTSHQGGVRSPRPVILGVIFIVGGAVLLKRSGAGAAPRPRSTH